VPKTTKGREAESYLRAVALWLEGAEGAISPLNFGFLDKCQKIIYLVLKSHFGEI